MARQYCGQLGKQDNCQVAVSLSLANRHASLPVAYQLYLPQDWAQDRERRRKAHVPEEIEFATKPEIALEQLRWACAAGLPRGVALFDAGYGNNSAFRSEVTALGLTSKGQKKHEPDRVRHTLTKESRPQLYWGKLWPRHELTVLIQSRCRLKAQPH